MGFDPIGVEGLEARVKAQADAQHERVGPVFYELSNGERKACACDGCARAKEAAQHYLF